MREIKLALSAEDFERLVGGGEIINSVESYVRTGGRLVPGGSERVEARVIHSDIGFPKMIEILGEVASGVMAKKVERVREEASEDLVTDEENEAAIGNLGTEDMEDGNYVYIPLGGNRGDKPQGPHDQRLKNLTAQVECSQSKLDEIGEILTRIEEKLGTWKP